MGFWTREMGSSLYALPVQGGDLGNQPHPGGSGEKVNHKALRFSAVNRANCLPRNQ